jgi:hypothetical protein
MKMTGQVGMANIIGKINHISKVISKMDSDAEEVFGNVELVRLINIKANTKMIKNGAMEYLLGQTEIYIKVIIKGILGMVMEKCFGKMAVIIKGIGKMGYKIKKVNLFLI